MSQQGLYSEKTGKSSNKEDFIHRYVAQVFIFQGEDYLGWDCFYKDKISIGKSLNADVVLKDDMLSDIQANIYFKGDQIIVADQTDGHGVFVNNRSFKNIILGPLDYVDIGPYTIKVKLRKNENRYSENDDKEISGSGNSGKERSDEDETSKIRIERPVAEKSAEDQIEKKNSVASKSNVKEKAQTEVSDTFVFVHTHKEEAQQDEDSIENLPDDTAEKTPDLNIPFVRSLLPYEDDEEDEEDREDPGNLYFLKDRLVKVNSMPSVSGKNQPKVLEVLKYKNKILIDVNYLNPNEKYYLGSGKRKFLIAEYSRKNQFYFYFSEKYTGKIRKDSEKSIETAHLQTPENLFRKKKKIYRDTLPGNAEVVISDGTYEYLVRQAEKQESAEIIPFPPKQRKFHKFLLKSVLIHFFLLIGFGLYSLIPDSSEPLPETHFVTIDADELLKLEKKNTSPPKPKPEPKVQPKEKPKVVKVEPRKKPPEKKTKAKPRQVASAKSSTTKSKSRIKASRHPDAGGGYGKGNVSNRNVNQTGLLSLIGDSVSLKPATAMAAVTNLDAVSSTRGSEGNFKVNGIVGKLGSAKIEIPKSGGIVSTKGSTQVLRSAGAGGKGRVAALEKGNTGQKQVMGMVTAKLTRTVSIRGGMSRDAVKRVIDQHLDEVSYCYENALLSNPSIMGKVVFEWKILLSGKVGEVNIKSSSINSRDIHSCIKSAIKTWQFPKPRGNEVIVSYPFIFDIVGF